MGRLTSRPEILIALLLGLYFVIARVIDGVDSNLSKNVRILPEPNFAYFETLVSSEPGFDNFAYAQYATREDYLEIAVSNFIILRKSNTKVLNLVLLYDRKLEVSDRFSNMVKLAIKYNIDLRPIEGFTKSIFSKEKRYDSFSKFHIFNLTEYDKVVYFDSATLPLKIEIPDIGNKPADFSEMKIVPANLDELFLVSNEFDICLTSAYWLQPSISKSFNVPSVEEYETQVKKVVNFIKNNPGSDYFDKLPTLLAKEQVLENSKNFFGAHVIVFKPSRKFYENLVSYLTKKWYWPFGRQIKDSDYDMDVLNLHLAQSIRFGKSALKIGILPHRRYGVRTGEFVAPFHSQFLSEPQFLPFIDKYSNEGWDPEKIISSTKLIHFTEKNIPKPWKISLDDHTYDALIHYCIDDKDDAMFQNVIWEPKFTDDCVSAHFWKWLRQEHNRIRVENLKLI